MRSGASLIRARISACRPDRAHARAALRPGHERCDATFRTLDHADVKGKRVLLRVDLNVPMEDGKVTDETRIERVAPTITEIADKGGKVDPARRISAGRRAAIPKESLKPVAADARRACSAGRSPSPRTASARRPRRRSRR